MSISFKRDGREVELQTFSNNDVINYLALHLNIDKPRFKIFAKPKFCNGVMVKVDDVNFIIHAKNTWIELSFNQEDAEKMSDVIEEITKWDRFSKTEETFYVEIDENKSRTIIFENGCATCSEYRIHFDNPNLKITEF